VRAILPWISLLALIPPAYGASSSAAQVLEQCSEADLPMVPDGIRNLQPVCPDLEQALVDLGLAEQLSADWRRRINRTGVRQLAQLVQRYQAQPRSDAPGIAALPQVMQALHLRVAPRSWWQQFQEWLRSWLREPNRQNSDWLNRLLLHLKLPPTLTRVFGYATIAAVLAMAIWIVWHELKAAGALAPRLARERAAAPRRLILTRAIESDLPDLEALPPWQRPAALLAALVAALRQSGRLGVERALTHRELGERGVFDDAAQRARFQRISLLAERQLYGADAVRPSESAAPQIAQALADGVALHGQLRAAQSGRR
jgi:hypothetical protein